MPTSSGSQAVIKVLLSNVDGYYDNDDNNEINARRQSARITDVLDNGTVKMKEYADDGTLQTNVVSCPFAMFSVKHKSTTGVRGDMHDFAKQHLVNKQLFVGICMERQAQYAVCKFYATSKLQYIELQTKPRPWMFEQRAYRKAESEFVVWGTIMLTDSSVPKRSLEVKELSPIGKTLYIKPMPKATVVNPHKCIG